MTSKVKLYQGECLSILRGLDSESIGALITDPPYSSGGLHTMTRQQSTRSKYVNEGEFNQDKYNFEGDNRDQRSWEMWCTLWLSECYRLLKPGSPACVFIDWRQLPTLSDAFQAAGFIWRGVYVWDKKNARPNAGKFRQTAEFVIWGSKGDMIIDKVQPVYLPGMSSVGIVQKNKRHHQTQKPEELMRDLMRVVRPDSVVLDPFMGSGSTGAVALELGHSFIGCEMNPYYFEVASERLTK